MPLERDEQNQQQESDYENELDEDDGHYKEAIPPAPKLQGTIPRTQTNSTQIDLTKDVSMIAMNPTPKSNDIHSGKYRVECSLFVLFFLKTTIWKIRRSWFCSILENDLIFYSLSVTSHFNSLCPCMDSAFFFFIYPSQLLLVKHWSRNAFDSVANLISLHLINFLFI